MIFSNFPLGNIRVKVAEYPMGEIPAIGTRQSPDAWIDKTNKR